VLISQKTSPIYQLQISIYIQYTHDESKKQGSHKTQQTAELQLTHSEMETRGTPILCRSVSLGATCNGHKLAISVSHQ
jgi:hypothetical protein